MSITHWGDIVDFLQVSHDAGGNIVTTSTATMSTIRLLTHFNASGASLTLGNLLDVSITNSLNVSGASIIGNFPITPVWVMAGNTSAATAALGKPLSMPQSGTIDWMSVVLRSPVSSASLLFDVNKNGTSIFTDQNTRISILGGGTYTSTASIGTKTFTQGDVFSIDLDAGGSYADATLMFRAR